MAVKIEMDMPKSCAKCRFRISSDIELSYCMARNPIFPIPFEEERAKLNNRPSWCPLKECA